MRTILFCSVAGVLLTLVLAESSSSSSPQSSSSAQGKHQQQQHQQQASSKSEGQKAEDKSDHDAVAQPATSYSTVVYHDPPPQDGGGGEGAAHSARVTKAAALGDIAAPAGAESTATFRLYHPKLEDYMSNMNPALVQNLMKQQPQTFAKIEQHKSDSSGPVAQVATKLLYPPKKYKSVMPGSQQTAFNVGYSIGFGGGGGGSSDGGGGGSRQPHPQALVGHEEVVTGKPKLRVRVEGKNSVWKQLSPNVEMSSQHASASSIGQGRYAFDHDQALGQSNTFDASNAVEDPLQLHQLQPLAMPLTFPLPLAAFDNVFIPPLPLQQQQQQQQQQTSSRAVAPGQFRTGHALQLKPSESPLDAKPLASLHSVHTLLPQENMFHQATGSFQTADGLTLPAMQHVLVAGSDGQMVPAYLIPVAALGAAQPQPLPRNPQTVSFFPHHRPSPPPSSSSSSQRDTYRHEHHNHQKQSQNLVASAASPHPERLKPFRPSQPLGLDGFTISSNPHTHASHHHAHRQRPPYATRSVVSEGGGGVGGGGGGGFKAVESGDQRQVPSSMYVLKPPSPEKASSGSEPSFSYQMYEHSPQSQPQPPKYRTIVQLRPVQTGGVGGVVSGLIPGLRPSRDLAGEQTVLNAILSQELLRKNSAARNAPIIAQTVYGVRSYR